MVKVSELEFYIDCNGTRVLVDGELVRPVAEWGSEQCEGCGVDICETGRVFPAVQFGAHVACVACGAKYPLRYQEKAAQCPDCAAELTDRTTRDGQPSYCDICDREVAERS